MEANTLKIIKCINAILLSTFILSQSLGCANSSYYKAKNDWDTCWAGIRNDPRLQKLFAKVSFDPESEKPTFQMMSNMEYPTEEERASIAIWGAKYDACMPAYHNMESTKLLSARTRAIEGRAESQFRTLIAELHSGRMTYGDFAKLEQKIYDEWNIDTVSR